MSTKGTAATAGVVAGVVGIAAAELVAALVRSRVSPVQAVGEVVIELTPGGLVERAIDAVGQWDKPLLVSGVVAVLIALSALAGVLALRRRSAGTALLLGLAAVGIAAGVTRDDASRLALLPALVGGAAAVTALSALLSRAPAADPLGDPEPHGRRTFLLWAAGLVATSVVLGGASRLVGRARRSVEAARNSLVLGLGAAVAPPGTDLKVLGVEPWLTPASDFYRIDTSLSPPLVTPQEWQLRIHGRVEREVTLTYQQLLDRGLQDAWVTLCCVSNEVGGDLISNALWSGVPARELLVEAGVDADADAVLQTSSDGWTCATPLSALIDERNALLAVAMNGEPLPIEHGFPVRVVVPGLYGFVSATKWVVDWEVTRFEEVSAYWTERGWSEQGPVKTQSRIDTPRSGAELSAGRVQIGGVAWAQHTGIVRVEVRVDEGAWNEASLGADPSIDTWVQWVWEWDAPAGEHMVAVRATDASGYVQTERFADTVPDGATGWHTVGVTVG